MAKTMNDVAMFTRAKASFEYTVGESKGTITVKDQSAQKKSIEEWQIALALLAGQKVAEKMNTDTQSVSLTLLGSSAEGLK